MKGGVLSKWAVQFIYEMYYDLWVEVQKSFYYSSFAISPPGWQVEKTYVSKPFKKKKKTPWCKIGYWNKTLREEGREHGTDGVLIWE